MLSARWKTSFAGGGASMRGAADSTGSPDRPTRTAVEESGPTGSSSSLGVCSSSGPAKGSASAPVARGDGPPRRWDEGQPSKRSEFLERYGRAEGAKRWKAAPPADGRPPPPGAPGGITLMDDSALVASSSPPRQPLDAGHHKLRRDLAAVAAFLITRVFREGRLYRLLG